MFAETEPLFYRRLLIYHKHCIISEVTRRRVAIFDTHSYLENTCPNKSLAAGRSSTAAACGGLDCARTGPAAESERTLSSRCCCYRRTFNLSADKSL